MKRFEVGARVVEPTYGLGSVIAVEDAYTRVQFDEHGVKKFLTSMSKLEPSDEPVPEGLRPGKARQKVAPNGKSAPERLPQKNSRLARAAPASYLLYETDIPSLAVETMVVQSVGLRSIASRKSPISPFLFTTLCAVNRPPLSSRG